jgi:hypothetical protein
MAVARDGLAGVVAAPLVSAGDDEPEFLVLRVTAGGHGRRRPLVSAALVERIDSDARVVYLRGSVDDVAALPEWLPMAD